MHDEFIKIGQMLSDEGVVFTKMFGVETIKRETGKPFASFYHDSMVFKLGRDRMPELFEKYPESHLFDPSGKNRPMKDWLQLPAKYSGDWMELAHQAMLYQDSVA